MPDTAGAPDALEPGGVTKTWNAGPDAGAGAHWYAHPMFQVPALTVNGVLM